MRWDILKYHEKIKTKEKLFEAVELSSCLKHISWQGPDTVEDVWNIKCYKISKLFRHFKSYYRREKLYACRMCDKTFWNIMRRYTQEKSPMPARVAIRHFEILGEDTQRRKAHFQQDVPQDILKCHKKIHIAGEKPFACRMCDKTFWNITRRYT